MRQAYISERDFALGLIRFVESNLYAVKGTEESCIPNCWTHNSENGEFSASVQTDGVYPFDSMFSRVPLIPEAWGMFKRHYFCSLMDLLCRLEQESEILRVHAWDGQAPWKKRDLHTTKDFSPSEAQEENYRSLLLTLKQKGLLRGRSNKCYKDDPDAVPMLLHRTASHDEVFADIPGSYWALKRALDKVFIKKAQSVDVPSVVDPYGPRQPILYLVATTARDTSVSAPRPSIQQIGNSIHSRIKYQNIIYVLADKERIACASQVTPRYIGVMNVYTLRFDEDCPTGAILSDNPLKRYLVPQPNLSVDERRLLVASQFNWDSLQEDYLAEHPQLSEALRAMF